MFIYGKKQDKVSAEPEEEHHCEIVIATKGFIDRQVTKPRDQFKMSMPMKEFLEQFTVVINYIKQEFIPVGFKP